MKSIHPVYVSKATAEPDRVQLTVFTLDVHKSLSNLIVQAFSS